MMRSNVELPPLYKENFNSDIYVCRIEIQNKGDHYDVVRFTSKLFKTEVQTIDIKNEFNDALKLAIKFYTDKFNDGYRSIGKSQAEQNKSMSSFPIGEFEFILDKELINLFKDTYFHHSIIADKPTIASKFISCNIPKTTYDKNNLVKPMKAKPFEFDKMVYPAIAQPKLNGVRCSVHFTTSENKERSLFYTPTNIVKLISREGIIYNVPNIEKELLHYFEKGTLDKNIIYDGEIYLPGIPVAMIAGAAKNINNEVNKNLLFVIFDICDDVLPQDSRTMYIEDLFIDKFTLRLNEEYYEEVINKRSNFENNGIPYVYVLTSEIMRTDAAFTDYAMICIDSKFEGGIIRDMSALYQFGAKRYNMMKLKKPSFTECIVLDVVPLRKDSSQGMFLLKNDINNNTFECNINATFNIRRSILLAKSVWIGKKVTVRFFERTKNDTPFHANVILDTYV